MDLRNRLMVSPTGARLTQADHPGVPISSRDIAVATRESFDAGAGALHLHVRDARGQHSLDPARYREAMDAVKEAAPDMAIQITTESGGRYDVSEQAACLRDVAPTWASVALREAERDVVVAERLFHEAAERGTAIQHILYTAGDIVRLVAWQRQGIVPQGRLSALFVLGNYQDQAAQPKDLMPYLAQTTAVQLDWMACAFGPSERACLAHALAKGGSARVGFENNIRHPNGTLLVSNAQSVSLLVQAAKQMEMEE